MTFPSRQVSLLKNAMTTNLPEAYYGVMKYTLIVHFMPSNTKLTNGNEA
jgi:hypothetical protein